MQSQNLFIERNRFHFRFDSGYDIKGKIHLEKSADGLIPSTSLAHGTNNIQHKSDYTITIKNTTVLETGDLLMY